MTAHYLLHWTYNVQPGDAILVHAAIESGTTLGATVLIP